MTRAVVAVLLLVVSCRPAGAGLVDELHVLEAKKICEEKGKVWTREPLSAEGYLRSKNIPKTLNSGFGFYDIAKELLEKRFTFFEMEQDYWTDPRTGRTQRHTWGNTLFARAVGTGTKFYRFYLAPNDSPACAGFFEETKTYQSQKLPFLRARGLPLDLCIASERTDVALSRYEMNIDASRKDALGGGFNWSYRWYVRDRSKGDVVAEITRNGYDPGRRGHGFTCPNHDQVKMFDSSAIKPISDGRLPEPIKWSTVEPEPFPQSFELHAQVLATRKSDRRMSEYDYLRYLNPVADNGNLLLGSHELNIINPGVGLRVHVRAFGRNWSAFQHLRFERDEIFFFGEAGPLIHSKDVAVFRYKRNAAPLVAYRIKLPDIAFQGDVRYLVDRVAISDNAVELTILDVSGRYGTKTVLTEYELRAPIEKAPN